MLGKLASKIIQKFPNWDVSVSLRYLPIVNLIKEKFPIRTKILEVGSGPYGIVPYLGNDYQVTGADVDKSPSTPSLKKVFASAEKLPFKANSFPILISVDTLEHLPKDIRQKSIDEMVRVASSNIYLAFPSGNLSIFVDGFIARYYQFTHKQKLDFLDQHAAFGLPKEREVINYIYTSAQNHNKKISINTFGNTNLFLWLFLLLLGFSQVSFLTSIYHLLISAVPILRHVNFPPNYRKVLVIDIKK